MVLKELQPLLQSSNSFNVSFRAQYSLFGGSSSDLLHLMPNTGPFLDLIWLEVVWYKPQRIGRGFPHFTFQGHREAMLIKPYPSHASARDHTLQLLYFELRRAGYSPHSR